MYAHTYIDTRMYAYTCVCIQLRTHVMYTVTYRLLLGGGQLALKTQPSMFSSRGAGIFREPFPFLKGMAGNLLEGS